MKMSSSIKKVLEKTDFTEREIVKISQALVNTYNGQYGEVQPVLINETSPFFIKDSCIIYGYIDIHTMVICFRGTNGDAEWKNNFRLFSKQESCSLNFGNFPKGSKAHPGFVANYKPVRKWLEKIIEDENPRRVIMAGHSLGAVKAALGVLDMQSVFTDKSFCWVGEGSPRFGNDILVNFFDERFPNSISIKLGLDIVTKVPPVKLGYRHTANFARLQRWKVLIKFIYPILFLLFSFKDHYPERYLKYVKKAFKNVKI